jgi:signal peptide peptidase SppA
MTESPKSPSSFRRSLARWPLIGRLFDKDPKVTVVRFSGIISDMSRKPSISYARHVKALEKAFARPGVAAVALVINSPGGSPAQSSLIGALIRQLAMEKSLPVYAFVEDVAASGGYWLACAADEIYAQESSIVGSIGVISGGFGFEDFIERHGIHRRLHTSGGQKSFLDPFKPEKAEDVERLKLIQNDIHESFIDWVKSRRGDKLKGGEWELFDGRFWTGKGGLDRGLVDGLGDIRSVLRQKFGEHVKQVSVELDKKLPFPLSLLASSSLTDDLVETLESRAAAGRYGL